MPTKILPKGLAALLIQGEEDLITPRVELEQQIRDTTPCPRCGGHFEKVLDPDRAFSPDRVLPRFFHKCEVCGYTHDPHSGLVIDLGNPAKAEDPFKIDTGEDD